MRTLLLFAAFFVTTGAVNAQTFLDSTFGTNGIVLTHIGSATSGGVIRSLQVLSDNKILAAGGADGNAVVIRYNENGNIDGSFGVGGMFTGPAHSGANAIALQTDGKIVIAGGAVTYRLDVNGSLDNTFGIGGVDSNIKYWPNIGGIVLALQPDGKIVFAGDANGTSIGVFRLWPDGRPDSTFGVNGAVVTASWSTWAYGSSKGIVVMPDGRIVVAGRCVAGFITVRMLPDGTPDTSFNHTGVVINSVGSGINYCHALQLQPDGKPVVGGNGGFSGTGSDFVALRYNVDGTLDDTFGDTGVAHIDCTGDFDEVWAMCSAPYGKFILAGYGINGADENFAVARMDSTGKADSTFCDNGRVTTQIQNDNSRAWAVALQHDGKIVAAGYSWIGPFPNNYPEITLARYTAQPSVAVQQFEKIPGNLLLYPNPAATKIYINDNAGHIENIEALDILGRKTNLNLLSANEVSIEGLLNGVYLFKVFFDYKPAVLQKMLIQKSP
ncbi:MAG: hypothetical protein K0Q79_1295 [Flavipsychrobacter sp.]|jgi:uncharacterized delta-60 repeat protein|nr:hypothetical protein [Flavipsychrobacter sp.]